MCGIFGCVGFSDCVPVVIDGLSFLEYRGYDSSGIAVVSSSARRIDVVKKAGRVSVMRKAVTSSASLIPARRVSVTRVGQHTVLPTIKTLIRSFQTTELLRSFITA